MGMYPRYESNKIARINPVSFALEVLSYYADFPANRAVS
ncbi:hypothetical protein TREAZ_0399 [Leadbettera azotonutricia ZAS-9]|uniref:Uncharacterized protein n=1 Tax=Leadbettera azotonutricia (strain ATCC BAA-888 / DSM 13862 / ZAS-9) TaxID=545695 RepID=F5YCX4_LEAAZ|nr:hypothetical protein TREAZ_0399 [Leadbettera azotonutricia ZAS-9]